MGDQQLFTWEALSAMGGASLFTFFVVQYTKGLVGRIAPWLPTDLLAVAVAYVSLLMSQLAMGADGADWRLYALALANAFLVAAAAGQIQYKSKNPPRGNAKTGSRERANPDKGGDRHADAG